MNKKIKTSNVPFFECQYVREFLKSNREVNVELQQDLEIAIVKKGFRLLK